MHAGAVDQVKATLRRGLDRSQSKAALLRDQVGQDGLVFGLVEQEVGRLICPGHPNRCVPEELRIGLEQNRRCGRLLQTIEVIGLRLAGIHDGGLSRVSVRAPILQHSDALQKECLGDWQRRLARHV